MIKRFKKWWVKYRGFNDSVVISVDPAKEKLLVFTNNILSVSEIDNVQTSIKEFCGLSIGIVQMGAEKFSCVKVANSLLEENSK